jgi:hypothetical protein
LFGRKQGTFAVGFQEFVARLRVGPEALDGGIDIADQRKHGVVRHIFEEGRGLFEKQRQVVFDASRGNAVADILVNRGARRIALDRFAPTAAKRGARRFIHGKFATGQQAHFIDRVQ